MLTVTRGWRAGVAGPETGSAALSGMEHDRKPPSPPVALVGASAGGLAALRALFAAMPTDTGICFVVVQHRSPGSEPLLVDLLAGSTALAVESGSDGTPLRADRIVVAPAGMLASIREGTLRVDPKPDSGIGAALPIDHALRSLAENAGRRGIAIVLSGNGSDGACGLRAVKEAGGLTLAQTPATAEAVGMPNAAIASGAVDRVLSPDRMGAALAEFARHDHAAGGRPAPAAGTADGALLDQIVGLLFDATRISVRDYKRRTLVRRIERRQGIRQADTLRDYLEVLKRDPGEVAALAGDLMLSVTRFFRDPESFRALHREAIVPLLAQRRPDRPLRIWVAGCATGEEAYSIAMTVAECAGSAFNPSLVKILASDIDERALETARAGRYPAGIAADVGADRLARFFVHDGDGYAIRKELRDVVVFARQNLLGDPPFSQLDLVSCRNVLIYVEAEAQKRAIAIFHFALNPGGLLFLGSAETTSGAESLFEPVSSKHRLFRRIGSRRPSIADAIGQTAAPGTLAVVRPAGTDARPSAEALRQALLAEFAPPSVMVDDKGQVLFFHGRTGDVLDIPAGEPRTQLLAMTGGDLRMQLREALEQARAGNPRVVVERVRTGRDGPSRFVRLVVLPVNGGRVASERLFGVAFVPVAGPGEEAPAAVQQEPIVARLERELRMTRDDLESSIQELATANEALATANEEVTSVNEELQSTNEELETSKEELQSLNEEISTVNAQLQEKVAELEVTSNDLRNLLNSTDIATVFLDEACRIKRFTPASVRMFSFIPGDVGRPITDVARKFDDPALIDDIALVMKSLIPVEAQVPAHDRTVLIRRVLPYRTETNRIEGVVVTFTDITASVRASAAATARARREAMIADMSRIALTPAARETFFGEVTSRLADQLEVGTAAIFEIGSDGMAVPVAVAGRDAGDVARAPVPVGMLAGFPGGRTDGGVSVAFGGATPYVLAVGRNGQERFREEDLRFLQALASLLGLAVDRWRSERDVAEALQLANEMVDAQRLPAFLLGRDDRVIAASAAYRATFPGDCDGLIGKPFRALAPGSVPALAEAIDAVRRGAEPVSGLAFTMAPSATGTTDLVADVQRLAHGDGRILVTLENVTQRLAMLRQIGDAQRLAETALAAKTRFLAAASHDLRQPLQSAILFHDILRGETEDPDSAETLEHLGRALGAMRDLLEMLLDISRLDAGIVEPHPAAVGIGPIIAKLVGELRPQAAASGLRLGFVPSRLTVRTDPLLLERILRNLVVNAIRYTDRGRVLVGCRRRSDGIAVQIWDTGRGISAAHLGDIFEEFRQLENPARDRGKGMGLGLAIVRRLCALLDHRVDVRSRVGHGSMFEVILPRERGTAAGRSDGTPAPNRTRGRDLVLLVEDDPMVLAGLEAGLAASGFRTRAAASVAGLDAVLPGIDRAELRCAVTDYRLPDGRTGIDALARIRDVLGREVPGIILTGDTSPARLREAQASGCRLLNKPADLAELRAAIEATPP